MPNLLYKIKVEEQVYHNFYFVHIQETSIFNYL